MTKQDLKQVMQQAFSEYMRTEGREIIREEMVLVIKAMLKAQNKTNVKPVSERKQVQKKRLPEIKQQQKQIVKKTPTKKLSKPDVRSIFEKHNSPNVFQQMMAETELDMQEMEYMNENSSGQISQPYTNITSEDQLADVDVDFNRLPESMLKVLNPSKNKELIDIIDNKFRP